MEKPDLLALFEVRDLLATLDNYEAQANVDDGQLVVELYGHTPFERGAYLGAAVFEFVTFEEPKHTADEAIPTTDEVA